MQSSPKSPSRVESPYVRSLLAGGVAGTTVDLSLFPLDTLKTRLQAREGFIAAGGFRGIYRGIGSTVVGSAPGAALFFVTYDSVKRFLAQQAPKKTFTTLDGKHSTTRTQIGGWSEPLNHMAAASLGEVAACAVRVPTEVVKQRAQALQHPSSMAAFTHIIGQWRTNGFVRVWMELYRGWGITIMREVPFTVIQFPLWEGMKAWRQSKTGQDKVSATEGALFGSFAGAIAAGITTPLDVLKTRMMLSTEKQSLAPLLTSILRESGPRAFFAGIGPRVFWISAGGAIFLGSYQWAINTMGGEAQ
ncbi:mitochondrial carrier domain-containing protein [Phyllosticta citrichinensis]|uniref:Mitochondrial carrier domain-containing protein n=1 Tax=Phyllosticta citrichinensis TaxID=1130410 RepID=A0ABR1XUB0_9PEZI